MPPPPLRKQIIDPFVLGIDLGTTNSVVAVMQEGTAVVIRDEDGHNTTPSLVKLTPPEAVGRAARPFLDTDPKNTVFASKRLIGRKAEDPEIQEYLKTLPYATAPSCNGDVWIKTDLGKFSPTQIGGKILAHMKQIGEKFLGRPVQRAVVTVPAYFNDCQKQATKDAGRIAGLDVIRIINEPTAAALAYGLDKKSNGHVAVYDLGGGTFDISILELNDGVFHVKATNGDTFLGGEDFDNEIVKFLVRQFEQTEGIKITDPNELQQIKLAAEEAKKRLSTQNTARVFVPAVHDGQDLDIRMTREQLEAVVKRVAQRTIEPCEKALRDARLTKGQINHVILVGGMTRMPYVRHLVNEIFGKPPVTTIDPDEAVAQGAAIQAGVLAGTVDNVLLLDVAPLSLGIEVMGGVFSKIVDRNTTLPFKRTETFTTSSDDQEYVDIRVFQGERALVSDNKYLGAVRLVNIPKAPRGVPKIDVCFEADANGITKVSAQDSITKKKQEIVLTPSSGLTEAEIEKMVKEAEEHAREDDKAREKADFMEKTTRLLEEYTRRDLPVATREKLDRLGKVLHEDVDAAKSLLLDLKDTLV